MSKHTPGPWFCKNNSEPETEHLFLYWIATADDFPIADIRNVGGPTEANAHLIETAPELLEAANLMISEVIMLRKTLWEIAPQIAKEMYGPENNNNWIIKKAFAAIAKAEKGA